MYPNELDICVCDLFPHIGATYWCCSSPQCKYRDKDPHKLDQDFNGDFREYFKLHGTSGN